jgi:hypothetical protein
MHRFIALVALVAAALSATAAPAAAAERIPFKASDSGTFVISPTGDPVVVFTEDWTTGHATHLGRYTLEASEFINLATLAVTGGSWTMTAANGDTLHGTYDGQAAPTADPLVITYHVEGPVLGGSGRFAGAGGFLVWDGIANLATGELSDVVSGWITNGGAR